MSKIYAMIDLETLGTVVGSVVLQVGLVFFNDKEIVKTHSVYLDNKLQYGIGYRDEIETLMWWTQKAPEAFKKHMQNSDKAIEPISKQLIIINDLFKMHQPALVFASAPDMDFAMLRKLFKEFGTTGNDTPNWEYKQQRCFRTVRECLIPFYEQLQQIITKETGISRDHDALNDAMMQAYMLIHAGILPALN